MRKILVINAKGGCGKTTIATNLASAYARDGINTVLFDYDPQRSSRYWLRQRCSKQPQIYGINVHDRKLDNMTQSWFMRLPAGTQRVVIDTPPGLQNCELMEQVRSVDSILVPVLPSPMDIKATADFIHELLLKAKVRSQHIPVGIIANRVRTNTLAFQALERFLAALKIPVVTRLRDTQSYIKTADQGLGIPDLPRSKAKREQVHWKEIVAWVEDNLRPNSENSSTPIFQQTDGLDIKA